MRLQKYFPVRIGDQIVWLRNFLTKLPQHAAELALEPTGVTTVLLDVENALFALDNYRGALASANTACHQCIELALHGTDVPTPVMWMGFSAPPGAPASVLNGCLRRVFEYIADEIKTSPAYNTSIGINLGVEGAERAAPSATVVPEIDFRPTSGGKVEVLWAKGVFDGVKLEFDLGGGIMQSDIDLRPNYTLNWLPPAGQTAVIRVRARYIYKGQDLGNWSDWHSHTLTGA